MHTLAYVNFNYLCVCFKVYFEPSKKERKGRLLRVGDNFSAPSDSSKDIFFKYFLNLLVDFYYIINWKIDCKHA